MKQKSNVTTPLVPAWHPDFRNFDRLPDIKVVRTAFYIHAIAAVVALIMLFWLGHREYQLHDLNGQVADWQRQIDRDRKASTIAVGQYKKFQLEAARVSEVQTFIKSKPIFSEIILHIAETLPASVALDGVDFRDTIFTLRGTLRGTPDLASGYASTYLQQLKSDQIFSGKFSEIGLAGLNPNPQSGRLQFEITLRWKDAKKP